MKKLAQRIELPSLKNNGNIPAKKIAVSSINFHHSFKPKIVSLIFILSLLIPKINFAQTFPPPIFSNGDSTIRGMYVSCGDVLIKEIESNGGLFDSVNTTLHTSATKKTWDLFHYCNTHYVTYIALYSLAQRHSSSIEDPIIGNPTYVPFITTFLYEAHKRGIKVGAVITNKEFLELQATYGTFVTTPFFWEPPPSVLDSTCYLLNGGARTSNNTVLARRPSFSTLNPIDTTYDVLELSEMLKGVMRMEEYVFNVSDYLNPSCLGCEEKTGSPIIPISFTMPPSEYLFDYMSLEYEYWDSLTWSNAVPIAPMTKQKKAWNNFGEIAAAMIDVSSHMCQQTKTELEFRIDPPIQNLTLSQPTTPWDTAAQDMPGAQDQVIFITKYFHRILLNDYKSVYNGNNMISRTAATHTRFSHIPSTLNPDERNRIMPVFSAATSGEIKHCFGDTIFKSGSVPATWPATFFGQYLSGAISGLSDMASFEYYYQMQYENAAYFGYNCPKCEDYYLNTSTTCSFDTSYNKVVGFMWFNYSMLKRDTRTPAEYNRIQNPSSILLAYENDINLLHIATLNAVEDRALGELLVYDIFGRIIYSQALTSLNQSVSLNWLDSGIYLCKIRSLDKTRSIKVTVIN